MSFITPPPAAPQRGDRATFAGRVDAFITWMITFVAELLGLVSNLNAIAFGGAYAIPFRFTAISANIGTGGCLTSPNNGFLYFDDTDSAGAATLARLAEVFSSSSATKAYLKITAQGDPARWSRYSVTTTYTHGSSGYGNVGIGYIDGAGAITEGEGVIVSIGRTGDKGDAGALTGVLHVRDEKAASVDAGSSAGNAALTRALNTTKKNSITGASLASNQITLPPGTYRIAADVPAFGVGAHQAFLYNVTAGTVAAEGKSANAPSGTTHSRIGEIELVFAVTTVLEIRHYTSGGVASNGLGKAAINNISRPEVYTEVFIEKVS